MKDAVLSVMGNMMAITHAPASDEIIKNELANFAFENYEIASCRVLIRMADMTAHSAALPLLQQSLSEKEAMAAWIGEHVPDTVRTYVSRSIAGETAGR